MTFQPDTILHASDLNTAFNALISNGPAGAIGDGNSHPASTMYASLASLQEVYPFATSLDQEIDWLAWQAALNAGGPIYSKANYYMMCNSSPASFASPLKVIAGQSWIEAHGAIMDFTGMQTQEQTVHYVANYNFADSSAWSNATIYGVDGVTPIVFGGGSATAPDPQTFTQFGQQVTLEPGNYTVSVTYNVTFNSNYNTGDVNPPYMTVAFFANSPGDGSNTILINSPNMVGVITAGDPGLNYSFSDDFNIATTTTAWLTWTSDGYGDFTITNLDIQPWYPNCALLLTRDGAVEHYPIPQPIRGIEFIGNCVNGLANATTASGSTCILYQSLVNGDGNLVMMQDCAIHGFGTGLMMKEGAYLTEWRNVCLYGNDICASFPGGVNSGENMRFYGGEIADSTLGISNPAGGEFTLYGTALDYCGQVIANNAGRIELHGVHVENELANSPLFHCAGGDITMFGGMILMAGSVGTQTNAVIQLDTALSTMRCFGTQIYGVTNSTGMSTSGIGTFRAYGWLNGGNPQIGEPSSIASDAFDGLGNLEPSTTSPWIGTDPTGINIQGGIYPYSGTVTDRWTTDYMTMAYSTDQYHTGTRSFAVTKSGGGGTDYQIIFLLPVREGQEATLGFWYLLPTQIYAPLSVTSITNSSGIATATTASAHGLSIGDKVTISGATPTGYNGAVTVQTVPTTTTFTYYVASSLATPATGTLLMAYMISLYARWWWSQVIGYDQYQRPIFSQANAFKGENDIFFDSSGATGWKQWVCGSSYTPDTAVASEGLSPGAPAWATHFAVLFDTESLPNMTFYLDDFIGYMF